MSEHSQPTIRQLVAQIAEALGETESKPRDQIRRIIKIMGADFDQQLLCETQALEAAGGLFLERENRRRTPGGVFFHLVRKRLSNAQRRQVFPPVQRRSKPDQPRAERRQVQPLDVDALPEVPQSLTQQYGKHQQ